MTLDPRVGFWLGMIAAVLVFSSTGTGATELHTLFGQTAGDKLVSACSYLGGMLTLIVGLLHGIPSGNTPADEKKFMFGPAAPVDQTKKIIAIFAVLVCTGMVLSACTTQQADAVVSAAQKYDDAVNNFKRAADAVNGSIALTSETVGPYCQAAITAGQNITNLSSKSATATNALTKATAAISSYCGNLPTDIQGAIVALTAAAVAARNAKAGS